MNNNIVKLISSKNFWFAFLAVLFFWVFFKPANLFQKKLNRKEACGYFLELRDRPNSSKSKKLISDYKENIKEYHIKVFTHFGADKQEVLDNWDQSALESSAPQYFLSVCDGSAD